MKKIILFFTILLLTFSSCKKCVKCAMEGNNLGLENIQEYCSTNSKDLNSFSENYKKNASLGYDIFPECR